MVEIPGHQNTEADILQLVKSWLSDNRNERWLMIIDNADEASTFFSQSGTMSSGKDGSYPLSFYIPQSAHGHVLITSRNQTGADLAGNFNCVQSVEKFDEESALMLLRNKLPNITINAETTELLDLLDHLPLAISQAAAYMWKTGMTASRYLEFFKASEKNQAKLLSKAFEDISRDPTVPNAVITSWKISFDQISQASPLAVDVLSMMSMLDRQGIPQSLLCPENIDDLDFEEAIGMLLEYSLCVSENDGISYAVHRLVQISTRSWLEMNKKLAVWQERALDVMGKIFPSGAFETWDECKTLLPHARKLMAHNMDAVSIDESQVLENELWENLARYDYTSGNYRNAELLYSWGLAWMEEKLGAEHLHTLQLVENLAIVYRNQGRYSEAELLYKRALKGKEEKLGSEHLDTLEIVENLAIVYCSQGRYSEATSLCERVRVGMEKQLGGEHPKTLLILDNLAVVYRNQERYSEAESLYERILAAKEKQVGPEHPSMLLTLHNLATIYQDHGQRYDRAKSLYERVLAGRDKQLGPEHPDTLGMLNNLSTIYLNHSRQYDEAEKTYRRILAANEKELGAEHLQTLRTLCNLATALLLQGGEGRYNEAESLYMRALVGREKQLGIEHPHTQQARQAVANVRTLMSLSAQLTSGSQSTLAIRPLEESPR